MFTLILPFQSTNLFQDGTARLNDKSPMTNDERNPNDQNPNSRAFCRLQKFLGLWLLLAATAGWGQTSNIKSDQTVVFFPSMGWRVAGGKEWELEIHGCIYELDRRTLEL